MDRTILGAVGTPASVDTASLVFDTILGQVAAGGVLLTINFVVRNMFSKPT